MSKMKFIFGTDCSHSMAFLITYHNIHYEKFHLSEIQSVVLDLDRWMR